MIRNVLCLLISFFPLVANAQNISGVVTYSAAPMLIEREGQMLQAGQGAKIQDGDWIVTSKEGTSTLWLEGDASLMMHSSTRVRLLKMENERTILVEAGEVRVTNSGMMEMVVGNSQSAIHIRRAIARFLVDDQENVAHVESGEVYVVDQQEETQLPKRKNMHFAFSSPIDQFTTNPAKTVTWHLQPARVQLAAAVLQTPSLEVPNSSQSVSPNPIQSNSIQQSPSTPAVGDSAASSGSPSVAPSNPNALSEEELRRLRPAPPNQQAANNNQRSDRGSTRSGLANQLFQGNGGAAGTSTLSLGSVSGSSASFTSGGFSADANQQTFQGVLQEPHSNNSANAPFAGFINLVTGQATNRFENVQLSSSEAASLFPTSDPQYFSIGRGPAPTGQVLTDVGTGTSPSTTPLKIAQFDAYLINLDQYGVPDASVNSTVGTSSGVGISGLVGSVPSAPTVIGATPLLDDRNTLNQGLTFALGEFSVVRDGNTLSINVRRSDQDRKIVKDPGGDDALDQVTANQQVSTYNDTVDARFLPQSPTVKTPDVNSYNTTPLRYANLDRLRQAAFTTLTADRLYEYSARTGQTRFVVDGKIVDISGYKR